MEQPLHISQAVTAIASTPSAQLLLKVYEELLCAAFRTSSFSELLSNLEPRHGAGPCTAVWTAGSIAYRCRDCQNTQSSAVCVNCFKAGKHDGHDYIMYRSPAGGCCDCGDLSAWKLEGCCPRHTPHQNSAAEDEWPPAARPILRLVLELALLALFKSINAGEDPRQSVELCEWLQRLCRVAPVRHVACEVMSRQPAEWAQSHEPPGAGTPASWDSMVSMAQGLAQSLGLLPPNQDCLAAKLVLELVSMREPVMTSVITLLLLLLYDTDFKFVVATHVLAQLPVLLVALATSSFNDRTMSDALDRLTVQLYNAEEVTLRLATNAALVPTMLGTLRSLLDAFIPVLRQQEPTSVRGFSTAIQRLLADMQLVLAHPLVTWQLLGCSPLLDHLLTSVTSMQLLVAPPRILSGNMAQPSTAYLAAIQLELRLAMTLSEAAATATKSPPPQLPLRASSGVALLADTARICATAAAAWASSALVGSAYQEEGTIFFWQGLEEGMLGGSAQIPLSRLPALFIRGIVNTMGKGVECREAAEQCIQHLLSRHPADGAAAVDWRMATTHILFCQAWIVQVQEGMWIRNGEDAFTAVQYYFALRDQTQDLDLLLAQLWLACEDPGRALTDVLGAFGGQQLAQAAGIMPGQNPSTTTPAWPPALAQGPRRACLSEGLRWLLGVLRERRVCGGLQGRESTRHTLLHWLVFRDNNFSSLIKDLTNADSLGMQDVEEMLAELADYRPPTIRLPATHTLKRHLWQSFDPHFPHFSRRQLQHAQQRAHDIGGYRPHWQLAAPAPLPAAFAGIQALMASPAMLRLEWYILRCAVLPPAPGPAGEPSLVPPEEIVLSALNLVALSFHALRGALAPSAPPALASSAPDLAAMLHGGSAWGCEVQPGILALLEQAVGQGAASFSADVTDCCQHLAAEGQRLVQALGLQGQGHAQADEDGMAGAQQRKNLAAARQAAIMERMRRQQAEFMSNVEYMTDSSSDEDDVTDPVHPSPSAQPPHLHAQPAAGVLPPALPAAPEAPPQQQVAPRPADAILDELLGRPTQGQPGRAAQQTPTAATHIAAAPPALLPLQLGQQLTREHLQALLAHLQQQVVVPPGAAPLLELVGPPAPAPEMQQQLPQAGAVQLVPVTAVGMEFTRTEFLRAVERARGALPPVLPPGTQMLEDALDANELLPQPTPAEMQAAEDALQAAAVRLRTAELRVRQLGGRATARGDAIDVRYAQLEDLEMDDQGDVERALRVRDAAMLASHLAASRAWALSDHMVRAEAPSPLPVVSVEGECAICREAGSKEWPLCWLAHLATCGVLGCVLRHPASSSWLHQRHPPAVDPAAEAHLYDALDRFAGPHLHCCGHMMHPACFEKHSASTPQQSRLAQGRPEYLGEQEALCPLCRRLVNCLLPAVELPPPPPLADAVPDDASPATSPTDMATEPPMAAARGTSDPVLAAATSSHPQPPFLAPDGATGAAMDREVMGVDSEAHASSSPGTDEAAGRAMHGTVDVASSSTAAAGEGPAASDSTEEEIYDGHPYLTMSGYRQYHAVRKEVITHEVALGGPAMVEVVAKLFHCARASGAYGLQRDHGRLLSLLLAKHGASNRPGGTATSNSSQAPVSFASHPAALLPQPELVSEDSDMASLSDADGASFVNERTVLWAALAHGIAHMEALHRALDPQQATCIRPFSATSDPGMAALQGADLRALRSSLALCCALGSGTTGTAAEAAEQLRAVLGMLRRFQQHGSISEQAELDDRINQLVAHPLGASLLPWLDIPTQVQRALMARAAGRPRPSQVVHRPPQGSWRSLLERREHFVLLLELLALACSALPALQTGHPGSGNDAVPACSSPQQALQLVLPAVIGAAVAAAHPQAASTSHAEAGAVADALWQPGCAAVAACRLLPLLQRANILQSLMNGDAPDASLLLDYQRLQQPAAGAAASQPASSASGDGLLGPEELASRLLARLGLAPLSQLWGDAPMVGPMAFADAPLRLARPPSFVALPHLLQDLYLAASESCCDECGRRCDVRHRDERGGRSDGPALCLVSGRLLCSSWNGCLVQQGAAFVHCALHTRDSGALLQLHSSRVQMVRGERITECRSPYLDGHGEEDVDLHRGRPLHLTTQVYSQLAHLWAAAALDFESHTLHNALYVPSVW